MTRPNKPTRVVSIAILGGLMLGFSLATPGLFHSTLTASLPLSYHGNLTDANGVPFQGTRTMTFRIYDSGAGGAALWEETQAVSLSNGQFHVWLGSLNPLSLPFDKPYWLGITVAGSAELAPLQPLGAAPYSLRAQSIADGSVTGVKIAEAQVVRSLNGLQDHITLSTGQHLTLTVNGNTLTISATTQIPSGVIVMWSGSVANIPEGWVLCNGANGTPDLQDRFIVASGGQHAVNTTGGTDTHSHTAGDYVSPGHSHTISTAVGVPVRQGNNHYLGVTTEHGGGPWGDQYEKNRYGVASESLRTATSSSESVSGKSGSVMMLPPYYALAFIMKQ